MRYGLGNQGGSEGGKQPEMTYPECGSEGTRTWDSRIGIVPNQKANSCSLHLAFEACIGFETEMRSGLCIYEHLEALCSVNGLSAVQLSSRFPSPACENCCLDTCLAGGVWSISVAFPRTC